jgi:Ca-activated chloride channel family protein
MSFAWPLALYSLALLPVLLGLYLWQLRRRRRRAVTYSSVALIRAASPRRSAWQRHVPFALVLCVLACLAVAAARPQVETDVPVSSSSVIVALDVSGSMCATDVEPNRLTAAQAAVRDFVRRQDSSTRIGLVVFAGFAEVAVAPTKERKELLRAIDSLTTGRGTTIGAAILKSVDAIAQINEDVAPVPPVASAEPDGLDLEPSPSPSSGTPAPRRKSYAPEIVVLLTDGANTQGITPEEAADVAASRGVRVYPIGFGTQNPTTMVCTAEQLGGRGFDYFGGGGGSGGGFGGGGGGAGGGPPRNFLVADEGTLKKVASVTGGAYFAASDADQLQRVLKNLPRQIEIQQRDEEVSVALVGVGAVLMLLTLLAAARWTAFPS